MALIGKNNHESVLDEDASLFQIPEEKSEKQKWAEMDKNQKLHYFIDYYLLKCIICIAAAVTGTLFIWNIIRPQKEQTLFLAVVHNSLNQENEEQLEQFLSDLLITDSEKQEIHIDDSFASGYESDAKLSAYLAAQEIDLLIANETYFQELAQSGCFEDINDAMPQFASKNEDLLCWMNSSSDDGSECTGAYGIDISDSVFLKNSWYSDEKALIGITRSSTQKENAMLTLTELFSNNK